MDATTWHTRIYATLLTSLYLACSNLVAAQTLDATRTNSALAHIVSGELASDIVVDTIEHTPLLKFLPLEVFSWEDEAADLIRQETSRQTRHFLHDHAGHLGLSGNLSLSHQPQTGTSGPANRRPRTQWRARASSRRLGLSLILRF
ncbi:MAG: hypothetical protein AABZ44_07380 [Elusimicrobiota bacterium]